MRSGHVKTKTEFKDHFHQQAKKYHPDKHKSDSAEQARASEQFKNISAARDKFMTHPDGFQKLASNHYLDRILNA